jgi:HAD superfamily hydrolase (TIGR01549 family)
MREPIIFDVEGTLIDCVSQTIRAWQEILVEHGKPFTYEQLHVYSGMDGKMMVRHLLPAADTQLVERMVKEEGERYSKKFLEHVAPFRNATDIVRVLAQDHRIALATSCDREELEVYLKRLKISDFVIAAVCGDDVDEGKPSPQLLEAARKHLKTAGEDDKNAIAIGDTPYDAHAANVARAKSIGLCTGGFSRDALMAAGFRSVTTDLGGLPALLQ